MFEEAARDTIQRRDYFTELDMVGDADFGANISKGFELVLSRLAAEPDPGIAKVLSVAGETMAMDVGSTIGGLFGQALAEAAKNLEGREELDAGGLAVMLRSMLEAITAYGGAKVGDKTLIDALEPAVRAADASAHSKQTFGEALAEAASAAEAGSRKTVEMVARKGRSSYLGERSRGKEDAGAAFIAFFLASMARHRGGS